MRSGEAEKKRQKVQKAQTVDLTRDSFMGGGTGGAYRNTLARSSPVVLGNRPVSKGGSQNPTDLRPTKWTKAFLQTPFMQSVVDELLPDSYPGKEVSDWDAEMQHVDIPTVPGLFSPKGGGEVEVQVVVVPSDEMRMHWVGLAHPLKTSLIMYVLDGRLWIGGEVFLDRSSMKQRQYDLRQMPRWKFASSFPEKSGFQSGRAGSGGGKGTGIPSWSVYSQLDTLVSRRE